jgi:hypothetical protein
MSALLGAALMIAGGLPALEARRRCSDSGFAPCPADSASSGLLHWAPMSRAPITSEGPNASGRSGFGGLCDEAGLADEISPIQCSAGSLDKVSPGSLLICRTTNRAAR